MEILDPKSSDPSSHSRSLIKFNMVTLTFLENKLICQKLLRIEDFGGNPRAKKRETKKGQSLSSSVLDMVNMIYGGTMRCPRKHVKDVFFM